MGDAFGEFKVEWRNKAGGGNQEVGKGVSVKFDVTGKADKKINVDRG